MRIRHALLGIASALLLTGCSQLLDEPVNLPTPQVTQFSPEFIPEGHGDGSLVVGLAFSGGGTRAAAYAYGILDELERTPIGGAARRATVTDAVRMVSGASGGAITAAYFGLKGPRRFADLRERVLEQDGEAKLQTSTLWLPNLAGALAGGVNGRGNFAHWLDDTLFEGARYRDFKRPDAPSVWINASDIWNGTPFLFSHDTFAALCSDLDSLPISEAVAASAAVPVVFKPIPLKAHGQGCGYRRPAWLQRALDDPYASIRVRADARALENYQNPNTLKYVKLLDGGLTDNFGLTGFIMNRAASSTPHGPLSPRQAVRLKTLLYLVADAGRQEEIGWGETLEGPNLPTLMSAVADTMVDSSVRHEFDAMSLALEKWRDELVKYRCGLSPQEVRRLRGTLAGWDCRDVKLFFDDVSHKDLDDATRARFAKVPTRLVLPKEQVDLSIEAGRQALLRNKGFRDALANIRRGAGVRVAGQ